MYCKFFSRKDAKNAEIQIAPYKYFAPSAPLREMFFFILACFVFNSSFSQNSCGCDEKKLVFSQTYVSSHQLIFRGKTVSVESGADYGKVLFSVTQLFKGNSPKEITVYYNEKAACRLKFIPGEDWIVYANFKQLTKPFVEYCSRSRKNVINTNKNVDLLYVKSDLTVDDETEKLKEQLGMKNFAEESRQSTSHNNVIPSFWQRIILIVISVAAFVLIYFGVNKFLKR